MGARSMLPLSVVSEKYKGLPSREGSPSRRLGRLSNPLLVAYVVRPAYDSQWEFPSPPDPQPVFCRLFSVAQRAYVPLRSDRTPRGVALEAYGERLGIERKPHRGEVVPVAGGPAWPGGVSSSIRAPPLSVTDTLRESGSIVFHFGGPVNSTFP